MSQIRFGIDIGGTKTAVASVSPDGVIYEKKLFLTEPGRGFANFISQLGSVFREVVVKTGAAQTPRVIGVSTPGPLDLARGVMFDSPNLHWGDLPLVDRLQEVLDCRVILQNDCNAAALGEYLYGSGKGSRCMVYVTMSTGIGGGVVIDGQLYSGFSGNAAEFGHMPLIPGGEQCGCGIQGCWEAYASGTALARSGKRVTGRVVSAAEIGQAWQDKQEWASEILQRAACYSGQAVAIIAQNFDPDCFVFGGGVSLGLGQQYLELIQTEAKRLSLNFRVSSAKFVLAGLGSDSALIGASALPY